MKETHITIYIHDLEISDKSKSFLARVGLMKLDDLLNCNMTELSAMRNISEDVLQELNGVIAHSDVIISFFEERAKRIKEILPNVQDAPIESLGLGTRATNALRRGGIHTVGALIQMSQKDIFELRNVGVLSREEITKAIESIVQSGKIVYHEREEESKTIIETTPESSRLSELLPEIESIRLDDVPFSVRARNALKRANIQTADELVQMSEKDIMGLRNVGAQTRDEILAVINAIIREGRAYFDNLTSQYDQKHGDEPIVESASKGFDFAVIDILTERFGFKPAKMTEWFGLSRQSVYNALEKRLPQRRSTWTGKTISESELSILAKLIENKSFDYTDDEVTCCCMNNRQDDFVCLFIYENEIKCLFLKDLPDEIREQVVSKKMHMYTERELAGESDGRVINVLTKPFYRPDNPEKFRANAQFRGMTSDEYAVFISGYPYIDQRSVTDEQIVAFMKENMVDGKVYISSDPKNQWIRSIASRNGYTIKSFIELYGFESRLDGSELTSDAAKERHREELRQYEELLCEEWFKEKIIAIANTKKSERQTQVTQRDVAIDYSRIRAKFILKNETDVQLILPDIRLKNEEIKKATLYVSCNGREVMQQNLSWYGNELGKTLNGVAASISVGSQEDSLLNICVRIKCDDEWIYDSEESLHRNVLLFYGGAEISANQVKRDHYTLVVPKMSEVKTENTDIVEIDSMKNAGLKAFFLELKDGYVLSVDGRLIAFDSENGTDLKVITPSESTSLPTVTIQDTEAFLAFRKSTCSIILGNRDYMQQFVLLKDGERIEFDSLEQSDNGLAFTMPFDGEHDTVRIQVINLANERLMFDRTFVLISEADCCFNREFYYNASDYDGAEFYADIDDFHEVVPFGKDEAEVRIPFRDGELHADIPKITVSETSGAWLQEPQPAWYIGHIPQNSFLKVTTPARVNVQFLVGGKDILYDGQGLVTIGNVLQSFGGTDSFNDAEVVMRVAGQTQSASYSLARVFFKERFLKRPSLWTEEQKLLWDQGGVFIGTSGREFTLLLSSADDKLFEFKLSEDTEYIILPEDMPIGNYQFEISIQTGGLFKRAKEVVAVGDCIIGDKNLLRFMNRRIVVESITDEFKEEAGHILIRPCYIDQIQYCGMEDTSEGYCPVYSGILYTTGYHGERYEFSYDVHTNKKGITKMLVNPVRIVYISDTALCITDPDGDGLYYYNYYDRSLESVVFALTDHEYTKANKQKYSNADLYSYRTERV